MKKKNSVGFSYRYNVANIDPMPHFRKVEERKKELREDYGNSDYEKMIERIAVLEIDNEEKEKDLIVQKQHTMAVKHSVVGYLGDTLDYQGLPPSTINYLQCIDRLVKGAVQ